MSATRDTTAAAPVVSIVIPVHNRWDLTQRCLESIFENETQTPYEVIVIDDASTDQTAAGLAAFGAKIKVHRNEQRLSFSANNNQGAKLASGQFLCLLNNDTWVTPRWLDAMVQAIEGDPKIGVVGNKHLFPESHLLHHCGIGFDGTRHPYHLHPHTDPALPAVNYERDLQAVTFACVLVRASIYKALNGLDEAYKNGYEDVDFCLRAHQGGFRVCYTPASIIYHYGQSSPGRKDNDNANWEILRSRWESKIETDLERITREDQEFNRAQQERPRRRTGLEPGIHLAFDLTHGNSFAWVASELATALAARGEKVSLGMTPSISPSIEPYKVATLKSLMRSLPYQTHHVKLTHYWPYLYRQVLHGDINSEFFCTNYRFDGGNRLDHWMRHVATNGLRKLAVSEFNRDALRDVGIPDSQISVSPLGYAPEIDELSICADGGRKLGGNSHILLITNSHDLYRYGTDIAIQALGRAYTSSDPVVVHIRDYGSTASDGTLARWIEQHPSFPRVVWHNDFLPKADFLRFCAGMDCLLAPFRGEGFGMKIIDAMAMGVPVIMPGFSGPADYAPEGSYLPIRFEKTPVGRCYDFENYHLGAGAYWCEPSRDHLTEQLSSLLDRKEDLKTIGERALSAVKDVWTWDRAAQKFTQILRGWESERASVVSTRVRPSSLPMSVVIPTKDREPVLAKTLEGYRHQSLPRHEFEILLVNDHGDINAVKACVETHGRDLPVRILDNTGKGGPGNARNLALSGARGDIVFITGDDIIPDSGLLAEHLRAHREFPQLEVSFFGISYWHPEAKPNWMMEHIIGAGGQQFSFQGLQDRQIAPFDRYFTSNVSSKRDFIIQNEQIFDPIFKYAAYEDIELAYRLSLRGLELRHLSHAIGYHLHPMTVRSFLERQRKVGAMLTVLSHLQPSFVPEEHTKLLKMLDLEGRWRMQMSERPAPSAANADAFVASLLQQLDEICATLDQPIPQHQGNLFAGEMAEYTAHLSAFRLRIFDMLSSIMIRLGMAEEWASNNEERCWARNRITELAFLQTLSAPGAPIAVPAPSLNVPEGLQANGATAAINRHETEALRLQVLQLNSQVEGLQSWISDFSIWRRATHKVKRATRWGRAQNQ